MIRVTVTWFGRLYWRALALSRLPVRAVRDLQAWAWHHWPSQTRAQVRARLDEAERHADRIVSAYSHGKRTGAWEMFQRTDELERLRRRIAQAALDGNTFAGELLTTTIAKPLIAEAAVDMNEAVRLHERQRFVNWLVVSDFDHGHEIAAAYLADVEGGKV